MTAQTLAQALEAEHHDIDGGIEQYVANLALGQTDPESLVRAMAALRRHIYLEEEFLFPPLKADLAMPIFVMLREHGQIWDDMDALEPLLASEDSASAESVTQACQEILAKLERHNEKEEPIIYAHSETVLGAEATAQMQEFLASGSMPAGWRCERAS